MSTDEQADSRAGLDAQRASLLREAERNGWELVEVVGDAGCSAKDLKRPGVVSALDALARGEADTLVVSKLDRVSRSMLDFASIMAAAQEQSWGVVALDVNVDTTTPAGEMMANVMATFAQFERRLIGHRTREALAQRKAAGVRLGKPRAIALEVEARAAALRAEGLSVRKIADALTAEGHTPPGGGVWQPSTLHRVLARA